MSRLALNFELAYTYTMSSPISLENLVKNYGSVQAVCGVSLEMKEGELLGLLGPNGAGKTSIISILTTLERPTSGCAKIFGTDVTLEIKELKAKIGFVPQELLSHGFFTVEEVLQFHSGYYGIKNNKKQIDYLLQRLDLTEHRSKKVRELSGGMKRRFLIAKAMVHKPKLLLLDEPTAGVDIELRNNLWQFVKELNQDGVSILLTTHYLEEAEKLCERVAIIHHGRLRQVGETDQLIQKMTHRLVTINLHSAQTKLISSFIESQNAQQIICKIPAEMTFGELISQLKIDTRNISDIKIKEGRLEDAFMQVLHEQ